MIKFNPLDYPICLSNPLRIVPPLAWIQHTPFAMFLIAVAKPKLVVELGTHIGNSYSAFCQAVKELNIDTECYAVDTWQGDSHAGYYGSEILADLRAHHDPLYGNFSHLLQSTFDDAVEQFSDGTIDLLHIDGLHTYEAVKHDFETWLPKLSSKAIVLFHDISVHDRDFGVWKLWDELKLAYPSFEFAHGHGLGILAVGENYPPALDMLFKSTDASLIREFFHQLGSKVEAEFSLLQELSEQIQARDQMLSNAVQAHQEAVSELVSIKTSRSWRLLVILVSLFRKLVPPGTLRDKIFTRLWKITHLAYRDLMTVWIKVSRIRFFGGSKRGIIAIHPVAHQKNLEMHNESIDIIVCVHNALTDVCNCLTSILKYTAQPYSLILIDDGSEPPTQQYLKEFAEGREGCVLIRNEKAGGYTKAANQGLRHSNADYVVLLNSDTIVGPEWLDRLCSAIKADERNGIAGPLSNTASWQSIPKLSENGDWALNHLPEGVTVEEMSRSIAKYSARLYFQVPLLNGFCMMVRRDVINDVGYFDEENFGEGYGEEDDFNLRAQKKGWKLVIADDVYVYHAQSKSYSNERRQQLSKRAGRILRDKHGEATIQHHVEFMNPNRMIEGIRASSCVSLEREAYQIKGRLSFSGKRILFVLPVIDAGGGANVVVDEARAMRVMDVDAQIFNKIEYEKGFSASYPHLDIPVHFGKPSDLFDLYQSYDAIIATANYSVEWLKPLEGRIPLGYYVQDYEPLMYPKGSLDEKTAVASYSLIKGMKRFVKTKWVQQTVLSNTDMKSDLIGISVNTDLFRPRHAHPIGRKPVTVVAMIRPESPYRSPELTIAVLRRLQKDYGPLVNILLFGTNSLSEHQKIFQLDFDWQLAGKLTQLQVANLLSQSDIFIDFSTHQAMGLTALEAMACGCSVIVPQQGGAVEFVQDGKNGLVVPIISQESCYQKLRDLVENDELRKSIQLKGLRTVASFYPEKAAYNILRVLFDR